jgi:hypothetical protein
MKKLFSILLAVLLVLLLFGAAHAEEDLVLDFDYNYTSVKIRKVCIDGLLYLVAAGARNGGGVSITQVFMPSKGGRSYSKPQPITCYER